MANNSPENVLSAHNLSTLIVSSLPTTTSSIKNPHEAIALASHAAMTAVGFRLVGLGEDHKLEIPPSSDPAEPAPLPADWNASKGSYAFRMGNKAVVMGLGMGDDRTNSFDVRVQDYISDGNLPATPMGEDGNLDKEEAARRVYDVFISRGRLSDLANLMRLKLIQKLVPSLHKEGYEESASSSSTATQQEGGRSGRDSAPGHEPRGPGYDPLREDRDPQPARPFPLHDPLAHPRGPRRPMPEPMPGFEDEFETQRGPRGGMMPGGYPRIGERDLYPQGLGPNDPFRGGVGPGLGGIGGGGMHPTFDDPLFVGQGQGGGGYDPRAPPGSRYDPTGPGMGGHPRGAGMGGRPPNPFGGFGGNDFI
ncbi:hypothetical protein LTR86_001689 [Recurvomyces mirabilis]|nr:hypothetical protein LTR86_001689 [Recurvomyces mirabilis]